MLYAWFYFNGVDVDGEIRVELDFVEICEQFGFS